MLKLIRDQPTIEIQQNVVESQFKNSSRLVQRKIPKSVDIYFLFYFFPKMVSAPCEVFEVTSPRSAPWWRPTSVTLRPREGAVVASGQRSSSSPRRPSQWARCSTTTRTYSSRRLSSRPPFPSLTWQEMGLRPRRRGRQAQILWTAVLLSFQTATRPRSESSLGPNKEERLAEVRWGQERRRKSLELSDDVKGWPLGTTWNVASSLASTTSSTSSLPWTRTRS